MMAPSESWCLLVFLAWYCGMRRCEARNVRGEHIDLDGHTIAVPEHKAGDHSATVFITPGLDAALREVFPRRATMRTADASQGISRRSPAAVEAVRGDRKAAVKGNGKAGFCVLHDLRRNFGRRWAAKVPAQVLQRMMRHSHIKTTMEFYAEAKQARWSCCGLSSRRNRRRKTPKCTVG